MRKSLILALLAALSATGCDRRHGGQFKTDLTPAQFTTVMAELGRAQPAQRAVILQKHHVTEQQLTQFIDRYAQDPRSLGAVFDTIQRRVNAPLPGVP